MCGGIKVCPCPSFRLRIFRWIQDERCLVLVLPTRTIDLELVQDFDVEV